MRFLEMLIDIIRFLYDKLKALLFLLLELFIAVLNKLFEKFSDSDIFEKAIFLNTITAFFAVILPVARFTFPRLGMEWYVNNPLAVYMIGIAIYMFASLYIRWRVITWGRIIINAYYLFWAVYIPLAEGFTKAQPHAICWGYYLNIVVPIVYLLASLGQMMSGGSEFR
jgi:hypothetical protein